MEFVNENFYDVSLKTKFNRLNFARNVLKYRFLFLFLILSIIVTTLVILTLILVLIILKRKRKKEESFIRAETL